MLKPVTFYSEGVKLVAAGLSLGLITAFGLTRLSYGIAPSTYGVNVRYRW